jgi:hypothetical protein
VWRRVSRLPYEAARLATPSASRAASFVPPFTRCPHPPGRTAGKWSSARHRHRRTSPAVLHRIAKVDHAAAARQADREAFARTPRDLLAISTPEHDRRDSVETGPMQLIKHSVITDDQIQVSAARTKCGVGASECREEREIAAIDLGQVNTDSRRPASHKVEKVCSELFRETSLDLPCDLHDRDPVAAEAPCQ